MSTTTSRTNWRGAPIAPTNYDDVATLVRIARRARGRMMRSGQRSRRKHWRKSLASQSFGCRQGYS